MPAIATRPAAERRATGVPRDTLPLTAMVGAGAGTVFVELSAFYLPLALAVVLAVLGGAGFVAVAAAALRARRRPFSEVELAITGSYYRWVVAAEVVALATGLALLNTVFGSHEATVPWIALVVGVHLVGLGQVWRSLRLEGLGAGVAVCGLAGLNLALTDAASGSVALVSGVVPGFGLLGVSALAVSLSKAAQVGVGPCRTPRPTQYR